MHLTVTSPGVLTGTTAPPPDRAASLSLLAATMCAPSSVTICTLSPSPDVAAFLELLERHGAMVHRPDEGVIISGAGWRGEVVLDGAVPADIAHIFAAQVLAAGGAVRIPGGSCGACVHDADELAHLLDGAGLVDVSVTPDGDDAVLTAVVMRAGEYEPRTMRVLEAVVAVAQVTGEAMTVTARPSMVSACCRLLEPVGCRHKADGEGDDREAQLARRLARAAGSPAGVRARISWAGPTGEPVRIPGDTVCAAAVAGVVLSSGGKVTLRGVLWDMERRGFFDAVRRMKGSVTVERTLSGYACDAADLAIGRSVLEGIEVSADQARTMTTDEALILAAVAAGASGESFVADDGSAGRAGRELYTALAGALDRLGCHVGDYADGIVLRGGTALTGELVDSGGSGGLALALMVAGMQASGRTTVFGSDGTRHPMDAVAIMMADLGASVL